MVVWALALVAGLAVVGYGARTALASAERRTTGVGFLLFGVGVAGYALGRLLEQDWSVLTWLCLAGPVMAYWGTLPGRPGATSGRAAPPASGTDDGPAGDTTR